MIKLIERHPEISLMLFSILMLGLSMDAIPLTIMEARNFITAREMLDDNNWILTTYNGEARYQKPPLPTWLTAIFAYGFGKQSLLALRWPAMLCLSFLGIGIYRFCKALDLKHSIAVITGFVALSSFYIVFIILEAPWDIYTHTFMLFAILIAFKALKQVKLKVATVISVLLLVAASVLSKGPISIFALLLPFIIVMSLFYRGKGLRKIVILLVLSFIGGLVLGSLWYLYVRYSDPETFAKIASRETENWTNYNVRPFYYYWSFFVQSGLWAIFGLVSLFYPYLKSRVSSLKNYKLVLFWTLFAVVLLSCIPEKKSRYLMPVLIPLTLTIGFYIEFLIGSFKRISKNIEKLPVYLSFGILAIVAIAAGGFLIIHFITEDNLALAILFGAIVVITLGVLLLKHLLKPELPKLFYVAFSVFMASGLLILPWLKPMLQNESAIDSVAKRYELPVYSLEGIAPEIIFYYGSKIPEISTSELMSSKTPETFVLFTNYGKEPQLKSIFKNENVEKLKTLDLNYKVKDGQGHRTRLINEVYKITKR